MEVFFAVALVAVVAVLSLSASQGKRKGTATEFSSLQLFKETETIIQKKTERLTAVQDVTSS